MFLSLTSLGGFFFSCCVIYGLTFLVKDSTILAVPRGWVRKVAFFDKLLNCSFCTGCWVGLGLGTWFLCTQQYPLDSLGGIVSGPVWMHCLETLVCYMAASATISYIMDMWTQILENKIHGEE